MARGLPLEIVARPQLSLVTFRLSRRPGEALDAWNDRNRAFLAAINARQRVHLSSTLLPVADGSAAARPSPCASACSASAPTPATSTAAWRT